MASKELSEADCKLSVLCLEKQGSLLSPEDGGDMLFWNVISLVHLILLNTFLIVSLIS
jgi:hypothetical protein